MAKRVDRTAVASDIARSRTQYLARLFSRLVVKALRLNQASFLSTEMVQAINPLATIQTRHGRLVCRCGHGRLLWQARTFHTEEPQTVAWLETLQRTDVLWDVGANVGLYSIYAAKFKGCQVISFEPESQNYALLMENIALNGVGERCLPASLAIANNLHVGWLHVRYVTKGGAYNWFEARRQSTAETPSAVPESIKAVEAATPDGRLKQIVCGVSIDELVFTFNFPSPTHIKIDVDGLEPEIIAGASRVLRTDTLRSLLIELNRKSEKDMGISELLARYGFRVVSERSNWVSRHDRTREQEIPTTNMIFAR